MILDRATPYFYLAPLRKRRAFFCFAGLSLFMLLQDFSLARAQSKTSAIRTTAELLALVEKESGNVACPGAFSAELRKQGLQKFAWRSNASVAGVESWTGFSRQNWLVAEVKLSSLESRFKIWRASGARSVRFKSMECGQFSYEDLAEERVGTAELIQALKASQIRPQVFYSWSPAFPEAEARIESLTREALLAGADFWIEFDPQTEPSRLEQVQTDLSGAWAKSLADLKRQAPSRARRAQGKIHWIKGWSLALEKRGLSQRIPSVLIVRKGEVDLKASRGLDPKRLMSAPRTSIPTPEPAQEPTKVRNR